MRVLIGVAAAAVALAACSAAQPASAPELPAASGAEHVGSAGPPAPGEAEHFAACTGLEGGTAKLPEISLPCFTGGQRISAARLRGPLVINFWASWCAPCREELPAFQRLADSGKVAVLGVVTDDRRAAALSLATDLGVRFPNLFDASGQLRRARGEAALPLTLFLDERGEVTAYAGPALTDETLGSLVTQRLGSKP